MKKEDYLMIVLAALSCQQVFVEAKFVISEFKANWHKAVEICNSHELRLAVVDSQAKEVLLQQAIRASNVYKSEDTLVWIGASDLSEEGNFRWNYSGKKVAYANWAKGQPDNRNGVDHCVEYGVHEYEKLSMAWQWNDCICSYERYFACEKLD